MHIQKLGDDLVVQLSQTLIDKLDLKPGDTLEVVWAEPGRIAVQKSRIREEAVARMAQNHWPMPDGYKFDREEANER